MNTSSAASFIDQIKAEYREVVKAETGALPHAIRCGEFLKLAKENLKAERGGSWKDWLETNCPEIAQETASLYVQLADHKAKVSKAKSIREARALLPKQASRGNPKPDADKPAGGLDPYNDKPNKSSVAIENHQLADLEADELCTMLKAAWEDDDLRKLVKLISDHLGEAKLLPKPEISNAVTNSPTPSVATRPIYRP